MIALLTRIRKIPSLLAAFSLVTASCPQAGAARVAVNAGAANTAAGVAPVSLRLGAPSAAMAAVNGAGVSPAGQGLPGVANVFALPAAGRGASASVQAAAEAAAPGSALAAEHKSEAAAFLPTPPSGMRAASLKAAAVSREVAASVESAGFIAEANSGDAHALGRRLADILSNTLAAAAPAQEGPEGTRSFAAEQSLSRKKMIQTLEYVASIFSEHYAPLEWKEAEFGIELKKELAKARKKIEKAPTVTTRQFQAILAAFVTSLRDHHVGISFYSTEMARLPFDVKGAGGKYFVSFVEERAFPGGAPFKAGDQIVEFEGRPVGEVVSEIRKAKGVKTAVTDTAMAEMRLTRRIRQAGDQVPNGEASVKIVTKAGEMKTVRMPWAYREEMIPEDVPVRDGGKLIEDFDPFGEGAAAADGVFSGIKDLLSKMIPRALNPAAALFAKAWKGAPEADNPFEIGGKKSFVPELGEIVWRAPAMLPFEAYIYKTAEGKNVGYIRVSDYVQPDMAAELFGKIIEKFQAETDSLVIDQVNNPGGNMFYMYALLARLTDKPLALPDQRIIIGEEDAFQAAQLLAADAFVRTDMDAMQVLGPSLAGYPVTLKVWKAFAGYFRFVVAQLKAGKRLSDAVAMMGIKEVEPHPTQRYTKPIAVLVNELDFSSADFFPAILQDNGRAAIFGVRTAGAGGAVKPAQFPNQFGIGMLSYTWTLALRPGGRPIENLGVTPDVDYRLTERDLTDGFSGYKEAVNKLMAKLMRNAAKETKPSDVGGGAAPAGDVSEAKAGPVAPEAPQGPRALFALQGFSPAASIESGMNAGAADTGAATRRSAPSLSPKAMRYAVFGSLAAALLGGIALAPAVLATGLLASIGNAVLGVLGLMGAGILAFGTIGTGQAHPWWRDALAVVLGLGGAVMLGWGLSSAAIALLGFLA